MDNLVIPVIQKPEISVYINVELNYAVQIATATVLSYSCPQYLYNY